MEERIILMGEIRPMERAALIIGVLCKDKNILTDDFTMTKGFGEPKTVSPVIPFEFTDYYTASMGKPLFRRFYIYPTGFDVESLPDVKIRTNEIEEEGARELDLGVDRPLNLDPGYLTLSKLILASTKDHAHRIYLRDGIFGEVTLHYHNKSYRSRPWTFPDYSSDGYTAYFNKLRVEIFKE